MLTVSHDIQSEDIQSEEVDKKKKRSEEGSFARSQERVPFFKAYARDRARPPSVAHCDVYTFICSTEWVLLKVKKAGALAGASSKTPLQDARIE